MSLTKQNVDLIQGLWLSYYVLYPLQHTQPLSHNSSHQINTPHLKNSNELVLALDIEHYRIMASVSHLTCPHHHIRQSFDLPTATSPVSLLTCPLPLHHCITRSVSHLTCSHHHIRQSFDLPTATTPVSLLTCPLPQHYCITALPHQ